jgi:signal transduction histidine kinase
MASFMIFPRRRAAAMVLIISAAVCIALVLQPGDYLPFVKLEMILGAGAGCAVAMAWLMGKLHTTTLAEHEARVAVEASWAELDRVSRHKSEFIANMSHELRTPLNAIIGFADVLREQLFGPLNPKQAGYVDDIMEAGHKLLALINDILDLATAEAGRVDLHLDRVATADLVDTALTSYAPEARARDVGFDVHIAPDAAILDADAERISRVVSNLVANAVRFSPSGARIEIDARCVDHEIALSIRDRGPGIPRSEQARIFDEFHRSAPANLARPGTGLGLAVARAFAELHGGRLELDSQPGAGSTFVLTLPQPAGVATVAP